MWKKMMGICMCLFFVALAVNVTECEGILLKQAQSLSRVTDDDAGICERGEFHAALGLRGSTDAAILMSGTYAVRDGKTVFTGTVRFRGSDHAQRVQGISNDRLFLMHMTMSNQRAVLVGRYTSYDRVDHTFDGIWRGINGRLAGTLGWIEINFL